MATGSRQDHLVQTALALFTENGFHATGIDLLLQRAGMSKRTLYTYFTSKEALIEAVLQRQDDLLRERLVADGAPPEVAAEARLLAIFEHTGAWLAQPDFFGCVFVKAVGEYSAPSSSIRSLAVRYKARMREHMRMLCQGLGAADPELLADEMALLMEGAVVSAQVSGSAKPAETAARMAKALLRSAPRKPARRAARKWAAGA